MDSSVIPQENPLRVLVYTDSEGIGGAEISLGNLVASVSSDIEVMIAGVSAEVVGAIAKHRPQSHQFLLSRHRYTAFFDHLLTFHRLRPQIIHLNLCTPWAGWMGLAAALTVPQARVVRVDQLPLRSTAALRLGWTRALSLRVDAHVAVGEASARRMEDFYALGRRTVISIPNGIPEGTVAEMVQDIDPEMNAWIDFGKEIHASGQLLVGIVGRLNAMKGHDLLLQAIAQVPGIHAVILGDGELRSDLEQLARRLGVGDRIHFLGWVENPRAYLPYLDIVALPSRSEGFPLAMVEAMLAARAIVATPVGSVAEAILDGETGLLVAKDDAIALAQALTQLRDQPELRFKLGQQAREKAIAEFTAAHMAQQYETLWYELRERPRRSRFWVGQPKE